MKVERGRPLRPQTRYPHRSFRSNFQYFCELHRAGNIGSNFVRVSEQSIDGFRLRLRKESNTSSTRKDNRESERGHESRLRAISIKGQSRFGDVSNKIYSRNRCKSVAR